MAHRGRGIRAPTPFLARVRHGVIVVAVDPDHVAAQAPHGLGARFADVGMDVETARRAETLAPSSKSPAMIAVGG